MWQPLDFYGEKIGRVRAVSPPTDRRGYVLVWADNGLFNVWAFHNVTVAKLGPAVEAEACFDPASGVMSWPRLPPAAMHGDGGTGDRVYTTPTTTEHPSGERLEPDPDTDSLHITDAAGNVRQTIPNFRASSEPWTLATFVGDLSVLLVADPRGVRLFKYFAEKGAERPRWKAAGGEAEQKQFLRAVLAHPDEDTPRLMYADWLDENGDPTRAEFIRVQCRVAERRRDEHLAHTDPDLQRVYALEGQMLARWQAELPAVHGVHWSAFSRGFAGVAVASPTTLVRAAKRVWAAAPVEAVTISDLTAAGADRLADSPVLRRIRHLTLDRYYIGRDGEGPLRRLFHSPGVSGLRSLTVSGSLLDEPGMIVLATSPHLTSLEWLNASYGAVTDRTAAALLASAALGRLRGGPFRGNNLGPAMKDKLKARFPFA